MGDVEITTPRGVRLAGTYEPGPGATAVLFAHGFLADRHADLRFDILASAYRTAGHATLQLDFSGCGASEDDVVTAAHQVEDLRSASAWLAEQGHSRQAVHAHSFGTLAALRAHAPAVTTMVLTAPLTGPLTYPWEQIFSAEQLDDLEHHGLTRVPDDNDGERQHSVISRETLGDYSLIDQVELLGAVRVPVLLVHDSSSPRDNDLLEMSREGLDLLPEGSRVEVLGGAGYGSLGHVDEVAELTLAWLAEHLPH
ncbi:alpha/beta fold hydrolase [Georgenia sp. 10Sc9-8]|uniref:Alpha/beta fold hydrolase n=1 Tax=Georgenia halotolerans TaxID=3028317 RepID=A0ABT5U1N0_9MICO|nr:alpha/beta fold hydrolase [Georgenia halotolerans]